MLAILMSCVGKPKTPLRPLATGTFERYKIEACSAGGHVVKLTYEPEERGEHRSKELVEKYRDRYLIPALKDAVEVVGWSFDSTCGKSGLTLRISPPAGVGEAQEPDRYRGHGGRREVRSGDDRDAVRRRHADRKPRGSVAARGAAPAERRRDRGRAR
jgi:hypothetical protein